MKLLAQTTLGHIFRLLFRSPCIYKGSLKNLLGNEVIVLQRALPFSQGKREKRGMS